MTQIEPVNETDSQTENRLVAKREEAGEWMEWEVGVSSCKPLDTEWMDK